MLLAIDLSLRSAGLVLLNSDSSIHNCIVVRVPKEKFDDEYLLIEVQQQVLTFTKNSSALTGAVIEKLAFAGKSGRRDLIDGNWWNVVKELRLRYPDIPIGAIPVNVWRAAVLTKLEQREAKKTRDGLKKACVEKLPSEVLTYFTEYLSQAKLPAACLYDLTDAYWLGRYRLTLT